MVNIISAHVQSFGKLNNFDITFDSGFFQLTRDNSYGKTTLLCFIRTMFYGLDYSTTKYLKIDRELDLYRPWHLEKGATFGGSLVYMHQGKQYTISRTFGSNANTEKATLQVKGSSKIMDVSKVNLGEQIFGINRDTFERSIFVHQENVDISGDSGQLATRLSNMIDGVGDHEKAIARLNDAHKQFKALRINRGLVVDLEERRTKLQRDIIQAQSNLDMASKLTEQVGAVQQQKQQLDHKLAGLTQQYSTVSTQQITDSASVKRTQDYNIATQILERREWQNVEQHCDQLFSLNQPTNPSYTSRTPMIVSLIASVGVALVLALLSLFIVAGGVLVAGAIVCVLLRPKRIVVDNTQQIESILHIYLEPSRCQDINSAIDSVYDIRNKVRWAKSICEGGMPAPTVDTARLEKLQQEIATGNNAVQQHMLDIGRLKQSIKNIYDNNNLLQLQEQLEQCIVDINTANYRLAIVQSVTDIVTTTKQDMSDAYLPALVERTGELLSSITSGNFDKVHISDSFQLSLSENGTMHSIKYYSQGTKELVLFCYRVALSEALYGGKLPLLLIDDAFVNLDDSKFGCAMQLLNSMAQCGTQIVYASCQDRKLVKATKSNKK